MSSSSSCASSSSSPSSFSSSSASSSSSSTPDNSDVEDLGLKTNRRDYHNAVIVDRLRKRGIAFNEAAKSQIVDGLSAFFPKHIVDFAFSFLPRCSLCRKRTPFDLHGCDYESCSERLCSECCVRCSCRLCPDEVDHKCTARRCAWCILTWCGDSLMFVCERCNVYCAKDNNCANGKMDQHDFSGCFKDGKHGNNCAKCKCRFCVKCSWGRCRQCSQSYCTRCVNNPSHACVVNAIKRLRTEEGEASAASSSSSDSSSSFPAEENQREKQCKKQKTHQ